MSYWTYITGVIEVCPMGRTQPEKRYILDTVLEHLPKVTGSERNMSIHIVQKASALKSVDVEPNDDETAVHVTFRNKRDEEITSADFPMGSGGGGGGGDTSLTKVVISAHVDNSIIKVGGHAMLSYTYDHQYASGDDKGQSTGQKATIEVQMKLGATTIYSQEMPENKISDSLSAQNSAPSSRARALSLLRTIVAGFVLGL